MQKQYDKNSVIANAAVFHHAFNILKQVYSASAACLSDNRPEKQEIPITTDSHLGASLVVPAVVNGAFACEILLKSMLPEIIKRHRLDDLFAKLDDERKKRNLKNNNRKYEADKPYV